MTLGSLRDLPEDDEDYASSDGTNENRNGELMGRRIVRAEQPNQARKEKRDNYRIASFRSDQILQHSFCPRLSLAVPNIDRNNYRRPLT
jgi:hypothetical protein